MSKEKKNFMFEVCIGDIDTSCGFMTVESDDWYLAEEAMTEKVGTGLFDAFPQLDIPYNVYLYGCNGIDCIECEKRDPKRWRECSLND